MMKRSSEGHAGHQQPQKKHKPDHSYISHHSQNSHPQQSIQHKKHQQSQNSGAKERISHTDAIAQLPPPKSTPGPVSAYIPFTVSKNLPPLPPIKDRSLTAAPFTHRSTLSHYNRAIQTTPDITYERLEFLGDAYIELIASRLLFSRFGHLTAGQQSQLRELLVKNETLAEHSRAYRFEDKVQAGDMQNMQEQSKHKGNKGFNKVLGDVFEAYVAAVILSNPEDGFAVAETWLTALWAPKLLEATRNDPSYVALTHDEAADPRKMYNPAAKGELQQRIVAQPDCKLEYESYKDSVELKGDQLGQNRHFIAVYLTGYGYERKLLGKGEGKNKVEAGNWAAIEAMHGEAKEIVEECEQKLQVIRKEKKRKEKENAEK